jgi:hypothetical protein
MMAVKHKPKSANTKNPGTASGGGRVHKVLEAAWHLALRGLMKVDEYICQEEA